MSAPMKLSLLLLAFAQADHSMEECFILVRELLLTRPQRTA